MSYLVKKLDKANIFFTILCQYDLGKKKKKLYNAVKAVKKLGYWDLQDP